MSRILQWCLFFNLSRALVLQHADLESQKDPQNFARAAQEEGKSLALQSSESEPAGEQRGNKPAGRKLGFEVPDMYGSFMAGGGRGRASELRNGRKYEEEGDKLENSAKTSWHS